MKRFFVLLFVTFAMGSCKKDTVVVASEAVLPNQLEGTWVLKRVLMGDMVDMPCGFVNEGKIQPMTLTFTTEKEGDASQMKLHGQSSVNRFFGSYTLTSFNKATGTGKIKLGALGSTKMASSSDLMDCESRYFSMLSESVDFKIESVNGIVQLEMGVKHPITGSVSQGLDNLLYFEKK
jgi:hypothetical protein